MQASLRVEWAHQCERPGFAKRPRARGTKGLGLAYERALARAIPAQWNAQHGQWYVYSAQGKIGYCQPDVLLDASLTELAVLECKLTNVEEAWEQLGKYARVLRACHDLDILRVVVVKSLSRCPSNAEVVETLMQALTCARIGRLPVLHWLGRGRL